MKTLRIIRPGAIALLFCAQMTSAMAITFTHDSFISFADHSDDGQDIVVTNCTLTVDGTHAFNSLQVQNGAVLTHSPFPYGPQQVTFGVSGEPHPLSATIPATLNSTNVDPDTIVVMNSSATITYAANVDYVVTFSNQFAQLTLTTNSAITPGAMVLVDYDWTQNFQGFNLTVNNGVSVGAGGAIDVSGKGNIGGIGFINGAGASQATNFPFTFTAGGGGAHGGSGGMSSTFARGGGAYDSTTNPADLGSGGGIGSTDGGTGGGVAALFVGGNLQIDGQILADGLKGTNAHSGGGAGGSILISAESISGAGTISANGGSADLPDGGGGGGGRIALYFGGSTFTGNILAFGGAGATTGGAGTIYLQSTTNSAGQLFIVNGGKRGTNTTFSAAVSDLTISGGAIAQLPNSTFSVTNLFVGSNSWLIPADSLPLTLTVNGSATVESNATINADFKSSSGSGAGNGNCGVGSGGGYGGYGGASVCGAPGGGVYGSITQPVDFGSPGGSAPIARGGGAISMTVLGTLSLAGNISANGESASALTSGGGSGGSVWLTAGTLLGSGSISANGGSASVSVSGGGSGGRVAVYFNTNLFDGIISAQGGTGTNAGGPGTVYLYGGSSPAGQLIVDNGGLAGTTLLSSFVGYGYDLTINGGAIVTNYQSVPKLATYLRALFIGSNSWYTVSSSSSPSLGIYATNATIQPGGGITVDGKATSTFGQGQSVNGTGGGGGNFGYGGASSTNAAGGIVNNSITLPTNPGGVGGSGGGNGGGGGGEIYLAVGSTLQLDGTIRANGAAATNLYSGGGAGGSIYISAGALTGAGTISANGGAGNNLGGGGGGGGIAIYSNTNLFSGSITAQGGAGANYGGAGTVYLGHIIQADRPAPQLIVDNGGNPGAKTPLSGTNIVGSFDLTVTGGAVVSNTASTTLQLGNLMIGSNGVLQTFPLAQQLVNVSSNATIMAGGSLNVDGVNVGGVGVGQSLNLTGGGGGGGGSGGASVLNALGGSAFSDSITSPSSMGSRGGSGFNGNGGSGGGTFRLTVNGTLRVDGRISADGVTGSSLNSGGGSGGSMLVSANVLSGAGVISANGGAGNSVGGGGGGGHLAILYNTNLFTGSLSARGGSGANYGGAGIIYTTSNRQGQGLLSQLILDNGGVQGGYTPLFQSAPQNVNLTVTGGATLTNSFGLTLENLFIGSNSTWLALSPSPLLLTVQTNATIQAGGKLVADGASASGPSQGQLGANASGGGGGHGGYGGASLSNAPGGNITSDPVNEPNSVGSRGGSAGGNGGGALQITVRGALQLDGRLSAEGLAASNANSGGGSGGAIWLSVGKLSGSGNISVNGGAGNNLGGGGGGGGGGGRIAIWYNTNLFSGGITARGGGGGNNGGAGTIYTTSSFSGQGKSSQLIVDNGGVRGTNTLVSTTTGGSDLIINNGASVVLGGSGIEQLPSWNNLTVSSNSSLGFGPSVGEVSLTVLSNLTIQPGGIIALDGQGYGANNGSGHGTAATNSPGAGGGAGHGGYGSLGNQITAFGGGSYDAITEPELPGSGGGSTGATGSAGGGALHLTVDGTLADDGTISANGKPGIVSGAGGGSGGSLWLSVGTLSGAGIISVDGGSGEYFGGGGGGAGGRIATYFNTNKFTGTISASGGAGPFLAGGAGTIYLRTNSANIAQLVLDNRGEPGTNTPLGSLGQSVGLSISNGAAANATAAMTIQNLSMGPGGVFNANPLTPLNLTVLGNALVSPGAAITVDGTGDNAGAFPGGGAVDFFGDGSGAGYGGAGGASLFGAPGGASYGSSNQPTSFGSPGGASPMLAGFSEGGGVIRLNVSGSLTVGGSISANGDDGFIDGSGGGSGGSIWITAESFSGFGAVTANGGVGESSEGGGGGGGRIAIYANTNLFSGNILASGGDGASPGQDGTIYILTNLLVSGNITDTNGAGVAGLTLQASGLPSATSDSGGFYSVTVPPAWSGTITPIGSAFLLPRSRTYSSLSSNAPNQNFLAASPTAFNLSGSQLNGTNVSLHWYGIKGVVYQPLYSTNLIVWLPYGPPVLGSDGPASFVPAATNMSPMYFRLSVSY